MAKHPVPGRVKTRLAAALGDVRACNLYRAFILDLAERLALLRCRVTWAYWPPAAPFADLVPGARCRPQEGEDLGARMAAAVAGELAEGGAPVLLIGADAPHVSLAALEEGATALVSGADLILGPAADGGYYLIGMRAARRELFTAIPWSTADVLAVTRARARGLRLRTHVLEPGFDVDEVADLLRLRALLTRGEAYLPRTAALLAAAVPAHSP